MVATVIKRFLKFMSWDQFETVKYNKNKRIVSIKYETDTEEYELKNISNVSNVLSSSIEGAFYEEISLGKCDIKEEYIGTKKQK